MKIKCLDVFFSDSEEKTRNLILYELDAVAETLFNWQTKTHFTQNTKNERGKNARKIERNQNKSKTYLYYCSHNFTYTHRTHHTSDTMQFRCCTEEERKRKKRMRVCV